MTTASTTARLTLVAPPAVRVECVDSTWGFAALRPQWNDLLRASAADTPFLTWEWLNAWWKHLHGPAALQIVSVRDSGELVAIAPLRLTHTAVPGFARFDLLGTGHAGSDYLDVIARAGREEAAVRALARFFDSQQTTLRLHHLPDGSVAARLADRLAAAGWTAFTADDGVCPVIPLTGHTWDSLLGTLGAAHRANVRRRLRAAAQRFELRFERVTTEAQRREALCALTCFHERRFRRAGGSTAFLTPAVRAFQDEATRRALDRGWLRMYLLRLDGATAAVMYGFLYNRQFYFYQHGFDDRYAPHSIGLVLMAHTIRAAIDEGAQTFDLLWGTEAYKWLWTRQTRALRQIHLFPPSTAGRLFRRAVETRRRLGQFVRRVLAPGDHRAVPE